MWDYYHFPSIGEEKEGDGRTKTKIEKREEEESEDDITGDEAEQWLLRDANHMQERMEAVSLLRMRRVHVALLAFFGLITNFMLRVNITYAIEYMTKPTNDSPVVHWSLDQKESIKSAFFIGYVIMQVPGGRLTEMFGTKRIFGINMFLCGVLGAVIPLISTRLEPSISFPLMYALRLVQGLLQSPCFPSLNPLTNRWVPESEKGKFVTFTYNGGTVGAIITFPLCGIIVQNSSWVWIFYGSAILTFIWAALWAVLFFDMPEDDPFITDSEKKLILSERSYDPAQRANDQQTPLLPLVCDILKTPAVWVNMVGDFANNFGSYVLLSESPAFFRGLLPLGEDSVLLGYICAAPLLSYALYAFAAGAISDSLIARGRLSRLNMQKVNTALAFLVPALGMVLMSFVATPDLEVICVVVLVATFAFNGGTNAGHVQNIIGLAPNRSGTLYGFTNGFGNISGYLVPEIKKQIVQDESSLSEWRWLFFITAGVNVFTTIVFSICASPSIQMFNYKSYAGTSTVRYFTSGQFLKFPVKAEPPSPLPSQQLQQQQ